MSKLEELIKEFCPNGVEYVHIGSVVDYEQPSKYLVKKADYNDEYKTPVLTAGQTFVLGYTNEIDGIYYAAKKDPVIIFDDFTGAFKWVDFSFKIKSSAIKLLKANEDKVMLRYVFHVMGNINFTSTEHKRLWIGMYSELQIPLPALPVQREIVRILDSFTLYSAELTAELTARRKQYEFYRDKLLTFEKTEVKQMPLGKLAKFTYGYTDVAKDVGDARFIRITDINEDGCLASGNCKYITLNDESKKYLLKEGDLLLARTGATYGKTLYFPNNEPAVYASFLIKIDLDNSVILNRYYWHFSKSNLYWKQADKYVSKAGQQQFNTNAVSRVIVPVPPIEVQERIVKVLDNFDEICSNLKIGLPAEMEKRQQQYEYYRDKLLEFNVNINKDINITGGGQPLIKLLQYVYGYVLLPIGDAVTLLAGGDVPKDRYSKTKTEKYFVPVYSNGVGDSALYGFTDIPKVNRKCVTIAARGTIGYAALRKEPFFPVVRLICAIPKDELLIADYLKYYFETIEFQVPTTGIPQLTIPMISKYAIALPPLEKQKEIVEILDRFDNLCNDISKGLPAEIEARQKQYEYYRDKLLNFKDIEEDGEKETKAKGTGKN